MTRPQRIVVALGGNALLERGEPMTIAGQRASIAAACLALVPIAAEHQLVISHGNGPQVGLLALQANAYDPSAAYPFDVLGAQTEGMIGYLIEQELGNLVPADKPIATVLTMTEVDPEDPAFADPTKFVGPVYTEAEARALAARNDWIVKADGDAWRRVVASPLPVRIIELKPVQWLLDHGCVVICAGGGGIPTSYEPGTRELVGVEAVIDKDWASSVLARELDADVLIIATDVDAVHQGWGTPSSRAIEAAHPRALAALELPAGSMGPKVAAAIDFATRTGKDARIGALSDLTALLAGDAGTLVSSSVKGLVLRGDGSTSGARDLPIEHGAGHGPCPEVAVPALTTGP